MIRRGDNATPFELRMTRVVEHAPIRTDTTFEDFPRLVDSFDNVVIDAEGFGPRDEIPQYSGLLDAAGRRVLIIVTGTRPAELGDHDALAGIEAAQGFVAADSDIDGVLFRHAFPVRQNVDGDIVDGRDKLRVIAPYAPDFTSCHWDRNGSLDLLNVLDEFADFYVIAVDGFVADHDA